jgi:hypothetical protein
MKSSLDEFMNNSQFPFSLHVVFPGFDSLYVRKADRAVNIRNKYYVCKNAVTIANVTATHPGKGAFKKLVAYLVQQDKAIYVECVQPIWFQRKLTEWGFTRINADEGHHYLFNYEGHLIEHKIR